MNELLLQTRPAEAPLTYVKSSSTLALIRTLLDVLHTQGITYCHWKSNEHLAASMTGDTDLDILFDEHQKQAVAHHLLKLGFKKFSSIKQKQYKDIEDYIGLDLASGKVIHVHAHFRLTMGEMYLKGYQLDIEEDILQSRVYNQEHQVYTTSPAFELILLCIREALKIRYRDVLMMHLKNRVTYGGNVLVEYNWLRQQVSNQELEAILKTLFADYGKIYELLTGPFNRRQLHKLGALLKQEFKPNRLHSPARAFILRHYREFFVRASRKLPLLLNRPVVAQRVNPRGGLIVAVVGADGSGKSTVTANLTATFSTKLDVYRIYFGRGDGKKSWARKLLGLLKPKRKKELKQHPQSKASHKKGLLASLYKSMEAWLVAAEKQKNLKHMQTAKAKGMLVICDRFPQSQLQGYNDGPLLGHLLASKNPLFRLVARKEAAVYAKASQTPPDVLIKLIADARVVEARKPGETSLPMLEAKIDGIKSMKMPDSCRTVTIDAAKPLHQVLTEVKEAIWESYK